ncbi:dTDP-4-dehydrorhamnose 3,5-epimerase [Meridianimaribacter flavus]|uniref:dTDP-4-dehydrorhamnose 3,5-epimerase n=1 Tax=Meridianimaribacter flavus TaxID=571115 RepID=A0ABY2G724_9FLAO|nr:dTDP-4-dehydrorhamnose 3,5-epimerase [Meridianimaribacter flavus]TDY13577.1 dTDP-4-dehydrorhamnose 3,5-epimerase [Meridianimaribacter flavus]
MKAEETHLKGAYVFSPTVFEDQRGYFYESFNTSTFKKLTGLDVNFVQDNQSKSSRGVLRGLHFQVGDYEQAKLVRVIKGKVLDVCVDLRPNSPTFKQYFSVELTEENKKQLFVPRGFAHGFLVLEDDTIFSYKCDNYYHKDSERGLIFNDPSIGINWDFPEDELIISEKDKILPTSNTFFK